MVNAAEAGEIVEQLLAIERDENIRISNLVFMGIGEPLDNYDNVLNNPASFKIEDHEKKFSEENYQKLKELVKEYIKYLK